MPETIGVLLLSAAGVGDATFAIAGVSLSLASIVGNTPLAARATPVAILSSASSEEDTK